MTKWGVAVLGLLSLTVLVGAGLDIGPSEQNIEDRQEHVERFLETLAQEPRPAVDYRRAEATLRQTRPRLPRDMWRQGMDDPYKRSVDISAAKALAGCGLASIGTAMQAQMAAMLQQNAAEMLATGDPQFASMGQTMQQESAAVSIGNQEAAQTAADQINSTPAPDTSGYTPTAGDQQFAASVNSSVASMVGSILTIGGSVVGGIVGAYYGGPAGAMAGASVGGMLGSALGSVVQGSGSSSESNLISGASQQLGSAATSEIQKMGTPGISQVSGSGGAIMNSGSSVAPAIAGQGSATSTNALGGAKQ